jgi:hypothetical protein
MSNKHAIHRFIEQLLSKLPFFKLVIWELKELRKQSLALAGSLSKQLDANDRLVARNKILKEALGFQTDKHQEDRRAQEAVHQQILAAERQVAAEQRVTISQLSAELLHYRQGLPQPPADEETVKMHRDAPTPWKCHCMTIQPSYTTSCSVCRATRPSPRIH